MSIELLRSGSHKIHVLGVVKGLTSEATKVSEAFDKVCPDKVAVSISKEELEGLRNMPDDFEPELSRYEEIYARLLGRYGRVAVPPPCYVAALELASKRSVPLIPVDLDEREYTDLYCAAVSGLTLFRHSTRTWLLNLRRFNAETPEEFVIAWDRAVNGIQGFRTVERKRAEAMAEGILSASEESANLLALIEAERRRDVLSILEDKLEL